MPYNPEIHHRRSIRLKGFDYSKAGLYFLTLCCEQRAHLFGEVRDGKMILNAGGEVADACWRGIPDHFPNAVCHAYVIMPNHVHGIIELKMGEGSGFGVGADAGANVWVGNEEKVGADMRAENDENVGSDVSAEKEEDVGAEKEEDVGAENFLPRHPLQRKHEFQKMIPRSIASIVKGYKIGVTKWFRQQHPGMKVWQRNYYEHVIRDEKAYHKISRYIMNNPRMWTEDEFHR
jgi:REP element-mobilizing transposase RayT